MNHLNEFASVTKLTKKNEIPEKMLSQSTLSKALRKSKEITVTGLSLQSVFERSVESCIIEEVYHIVLFLIAANCFSPYWFSWSSGLVVRVLDSQLRGSKVESAFHPSEVV